MTNWIFWLGLVLLSPTVEIGGIISIGTPFLAVGCCLRGLQFCKRDFRVSFGLTEVSAGLYVVCLLMSLVWSDQLLVAGYRAIYHPVGLVLFFGMLQRQDTQSEFRQLQFWSFALTSAGLAMAIDFLILMGALALQGRLGEAFADRVTGGIMSLKWAGSNTIASAILASLYPALMLSGNLGRFAKCAVAAMLLAILATLSRNSAICVLASIIVYAMLSGRAVSTISAILGVGIVVGIGLWMIDADVFDFIVRSRIESGDTDSLNGRTRTWEAAWSAICRNWPCPIGYYGSTTVLGHTPHNLIMIELLEVGFWGLGLHLILFAGTAGLLLKARSRRRRAGKSTNDLDILLSGLACIFINLLFEDPQYTQPYIVCNWLFMGICLATARLPDDLKAHFASEGRAKAIPDSRLRRGTRVAVKQPLGALPQKRLSW